MTDQELQQLAKAYAVEYSYHKDVADDAEEFLRWLTKTHCIVSREKVKELCRLAIGNINNVDYGLIDGLTDMVCDMFNEEYHKEIDNE